MRVFLTCCSLSLQMGAGERRRHPRNAESVGPHPGRRRGLPPRAVHGNLQVCRVCRRGHFHELQAAAGVPQPQGRGTAGQQHSRLHWRRVVFVGALVCVCAVALLRCVRVRVRTCTRVHWASSLMPFAVFVRVSVCVPSGRRVFRVCGLRQHVGVCASQHPSSQWCVSVLFFPRDPPVPFPLLFF